MCRTKNIEIRGRGMILEGNPRSLLLVGDEHGSNLATFQELQQEINNLQQVINNLNIQSTNMQEHIVPGLSINIADFILIIMAALIAAALTVIILYNVILLALMLSN